MLLIQCNHLFLFLNCLAENTSWIGQIWALKLSQISSITYVVLSWKLWPMTSSLAFMLNFYPRIVPNTHINPNKLFFPFPLPIWDEINLQKKEKYLFPYFISNFSFYPYNLWFSHKADRIFIWIWKFISNCIDVQLIWFQRLCDSY